VQNWLAASLITLVALIVFWLLRRFLASRIPRWVGRTENQVDDLLATLLKQTKLWFLFIVALYLGSLVLTLEADVSLWVGRGVTIAAFLQAGIWGGTAISFSVKRYKRENLEEDASTVTVVSALGIIASIAVWSLVLLLILDNLGVEITSLIAGLGIAGVAVGLAVQNILGDLFASLSIILDKPFVIGDFITVGELLGTVEKIGLKTTRVRSLTGEELVFSNTDLLQSRIRNYKTLAERRVTFSFGVTYETSPAQLEGIPAMVQETIEARQPVRFDRAHFQEFGDFSLNYEVVYYVMDPDYNLYMDIQQAINLGLMRRFAEAGIEFAYPTQTVFLEGSGNGGNVKSEVMG
jgi:small-conductance mechanosensitive channel